MTTHATTPAWFDAAYYLSAKAAQCGLDMPTLLDALSAAGYSNSYDHYVEWGISEGLNPNALFNESEYLAAKTVQLGPGWTVGKTRQTISDAGLTAAEHYDRYGWQEGVNPSAGFDVGQYVAVKALECGLSETAVTQAFVQCGLSPVEHYLLYAAAEGITQETWEAWLHPAPVEPWDVSVDYSFDETTTKHSATDTETKQDGETTVHTEVTVTHSETDSTETIVVTIIGTNSAGTLADAWGMLDGVGD